MLRSMPSSIEKEQRTIFPHVPPNWGTPPTRARDRSVTSHWIRFWLAFGPAPSGLSLSLPRKAILIGPIAGGSACTPLRGGCIFVRRTWQTGSMCPIGRELMYRWPVRVRWTVVALLIPRSTRVRDRVSNDRRIIPTRTGHPGTPRVCVPRQPSMVREFGSRYLTSARPRCAERHGRPDVRISSARAEHLESSRTREAFRNASRTRAMASLLVVEVDSEVKFIIREFARAASYEAVYRC